MLYQDLMNPPKANSTCQLGALESTPVGLVSFMVGVYAMLKTDHDGKTKKCVQRKDFGGNVHSFSLSYLVGQVVR